MLVSLALTLSAVVAIVLADAINFDNLPTGAPPPGWTATKTGTGQAKWTVEKDDTAPSKPNVLKQSGQATYPVCIKEDSSLKDGFVEVKFKPISGREDQAGGLVWRAKDSDNYYVARANALEDNGSGAESPVSRGSTSRPAEGRNSNLRAALILQPPRPPRSPRSREKLISVYSACSMVREITEKN